MCLDRVRRWRRVCGASDGGEEWAVRSERWRTGSGKDGTRGGVRGGRRGGEAGDGEVGGEERREENGSWCRYDCERCEREDEVMTEEVEMDGGMMWSWGTTRTGGEVREGGRDEGMKGEGEMKKGVGWGGRKDGGDVGQKVDEKEGGGRWVRQWAKATGD